MWLGLFFTFAGTYLAYFTFLKFHSNQPWRLQIDPFYSPLITILVPAYNEEKVIRQKLENLAGIAYPKEKIEIIVIDDSSTDQTLTRISNFSETHPELKIKILKNPQRMGKANGLNAALQIALNDIIIVTDADSFWPQDILEKVLPYVSNPKIGAVTGFGVAMNKDRSWATEAEKNYLKLMFLLRLGESKIHSTIRFEGSFCIFKRQAFDKFDNESGADDSGTALRVIQNNFRAILVPEAYAFSEFPSSFKARTKVKIRRSVHLSELWLKCLKLFLKGRLALPKRIAVPEFFLSIFNPIIFVALTCVTLLLAAFYPILLIPLILTFSVVVLIPKTRNSVIQGILDQFILFYSLILSISKKKILTWDK